jgi:hypothetical protein
MFKFMTLIILFWIGKISLLYKVINGEKNVYIMLFWVSLFIHQNCKSVL